MAECYFSVQIGHNHSLCIASLTDRKIALSGAELADTSGYFLYEQHGTGDAVDVEVIAHVVSQEAAFRLRDMFKMV